MTSINNYQCHYTLIKKMMTSKPEDRLRKNGVKTRKYYKWLRWSMKNYYFSIIKSDSVMFNMNIDDIMNLIKERDMRSIEF